MTKALVAGCGYLGRKLAKLLAISGYQVIALKRRPTDLPTGVLPFYADLGDLAALEKLPKDIDLLFYCAAPDAQSEISCHNSYVLGLENLLQVFSLNGTKPNRLLYVSTTGVYSQTDGSWVDEESEVDPKRISSIKSLEGEQLCGAQEIPSTVVRLGGIYGPGREGLLTRIRTGSLALACGPTKYTNRIHLEDAARALSHLAQLSSPDSLYIAVDDQPSDNNLVIASLACALAVETPRYAEKTHSTSSNKRCCNKKLKETGFQFRYPSWREGYEELIGKPIKLQHA